MGDEKEESNNGARRAPTNLAEDLVQLYARDPNIEKILKEKGEISRVIAFAEDASDRTRYDVVRVFRNELKFEINLNEMIKDDVGKMRKIFSEFYPDGFSVRDLENLIQTESTTERKLLRIEAFDHSYEISLTTPSLFKWMDQYSSATAEEKIQVARALKPLVMAEIDALDSFRNRAELHLLTMKNFVEKAGPTLSKEEYYRFRRLLMDWVKILREGKKPLQ